ncbi:MAG: hypothetical protein SynsKO_36560 [Synoicihabitans sp.]
MQPSSPLQYYKESFEKLHAITSVRRFEDWGATTGVGIDLEVRHPYPVHSKYRLFEFELGELRLLVMTQSSHEDPQLAADLLRRNNAKVAKILPRIQLKELSHN